MEQLASLLAALGREPDELISIESFSRGYREFLTVEQVSTHTELGDGDWYFSVNPLRERPKKGRGKSQDFPKLTTLWIDLDAGKVDCQALLDRMTDVVGVPPVAVVHTGSGGMHPYWRLTEPITPSLLRAWGRLVKVEAKKLGGKADSVFDPARVLRLPGVTRPNGTKATLTLATEPVALDARELTNLVISYAVGVEKVSANEVAFEDWKPAVETCPYVRTMIEAWPDEEPADSRHDWLLNKMNRLMSAARLGCITAEDFRIGEQNAINRFRQTLVTGVKPRKENDGEVMGIIDAAKENTERKTEEYMRTQELDHDCLNEETTEDELTLKRLRELRANRRAQQLHRIEIREETMRPGRLVTGQAIFDLPTDPVPIWGDGEEVFLAEGEALVIVGDSGVGKTTVAQQLAMGRLGVESFESLLGYSIKPGEKNVLYLAMDRPSQAMRSIRRMVREQDRELLAERLRIWQGPPMHDFINDFQKLTQMCIEADADTLIVDSLKDVGKMLDDEGGSGWNRSRQEALAYGVQMIELHHNKKATTGEIADVYGSVWIPNGAGSVIALDGKPGDELVTLKHLKQPAAKIGPLEVEHDHPRGRSSIADKFDLMRLLRQRGEVTAKDVAQVMNNKQEATKSDVQRARRALDKLVSAGQAIEHPGRKGGQAARWVPAQITEQITRPQITL